MTLQLPSEDPHPLPPCQTRTDAFHRQSLLLVEPRAGETSNPRVVSSWNEAHALHGAARIDDLNPAYVAALISGNNNAEASPYKRIHRLPRAHDVKIEANGSVSSHPYDPFAVGAGPMVVDELYAFLQQGLVRHIRAALDSQSGLIGCEHSSGLDSNAVLGALLQSADVNRDRLHTWSHEQGGEAPLLEEFRRFHGLLPNHCHRREDLVARVLNSDQRSGNKSAEKFLWERLQVYGALPLIGAGFMAAAHLEKQGCTVLFSGFGGDQAISHNAANVPTDLIAQGRWLELVRWMGGKRKALKAGANLLLAQCSRRLSERGIVKRRRGFRVNELLLRHLRPAGIDWLGSNISERPGWEHDPYQSQHNSIRLRALADWVAVRVEEETRLAKAFGMIKVFPLLDETLIGTLLQQDPIVFGEGVGKGRLLHRRAFAPYLPPYLRDNPSKSRETTSEQHEAMEGLRHRRKQTIKRALLNSHEWHPLLNHWWDIEAMRNDIERIIEQQQASFEQIMGVSSSLHTAKLLSGWLKALE
jgi:asparagine synthetase B (glutamine-hydrolysing)